MGKTFSSMYREIWDKVAHPKRVGWLGSGLVLLIIIEVIATVLIPDTREYFYNIVENKDVANFMGAMAYYSGVLLVFGLCQGYKGWLGHAMALDFRTAITKLLLKKWVKGDVERVSLADQRIQEDAKLCTDLTIRVFLEVIISFLIVCGLVGSVWGNWPIFFASFGYASAVILVALFFKKPLVDKEITLQVSEGNFRTSLTKLALNQGDYTSKPLYRKVKKAYLELIGVLRNYTIFNRVKGALSSMIPLLILTPKYFAGEVTLGTLMEAVVIFDLLVINSTILVLYYADVTKASASWKRVIEFRSKLR